MEERFFKPKSGKFNLTSIYFMVHNTNVSDITGTQLSWQRGNLNAVPRTPLTNHHDFLHMIRTPQSVSRDKDEF